MATRMRGRRMERVGNMVDEGAEEGVEKRR